MRRILICVAIALQITGIWLALMVGTITGPSANPDSPVRNILYAHIPSAVCALLCFAVLMISSVLYLIKSKPVFDHIATASAEVAFVLTSILNATGMIFSRAEWNIWWTTSPRLITSAMLWFLAVVYLILRISLADSPRRRARICAIYGIIAFIDVPLVYITARFLPDIHRPNFNFESNFQRISLMLLMLATALLAAALIWLRTDMFINKTKLEQELS